MRFQRFFTSLGTSLMLLSSTYAGERAKIDTIVSSLTQEQPTMSCEGLDVISTQTKQFGPMSNEQYAYDDVLVRLRTHNKGGQEFEVIGTTYHGDYSFTTYRVVDGSPDTLYDGYVDSATITRTHVRDIARKLPLGRFVVDPAPEKYFVSSNNRGIPETLKRYWRIQQGIFSPRFNYIVQPKQEIHDNEERVMLCDRQFFRDGIRFVAEKLEKSNKETNLNHE